MKHIFIIALTITVAFQTIPLFAGGNAYEGKLLEHALIESAVTKEQKTAVTHYLQSLVAEKRMIADSYREKASIEYGGKAMSQKVRAKEFLKIAENFDRIAESYKSLAENYSMDESKKLAISK